MADLEKMLSPKDASILDASQPINWVPKEPGEILLPYMEKDPPADLTDIDNRREKARKVIAGYDDIIQKCKELEANISKRCKDVKVPVSAATHFNVVQAISRVFGIPEEEVKEITFDMYKRCIQELAALNNEGLPSVGGQ